MENVKVIPIRRYEESDGGLSCIEYMQEVPFLVKRIFTIDGIPDNHVRANHAIRNNTFFYTVLNGTVIIDVDSGDKTETFRLDSKEHMGLLVPPLRWVKIRDLEPNAIFVAMASKEYFKDDYIEDYEIFLRERESMEVVHEDNNTRCK